MSDIIYREITAADMAAVIDLANEVHGDNYLNEDSFQQYLIAGTVGDVQLNWIALRSRDPLGVRITTAPGQWPIDDFAPQTHGQFRPISCATLNAQPCQKRHEVWA